MRFCFFIIGLLLCLLNRETAFAQCNVNAAATDYQIVCGECVTLSHAGYTPGNVSFSEDFNSGNPTGWAYTQQASFNNPCSPGGADGTTHIWMGDNSGVPRSLETVALDFGPGVAPAGGTICFDLLFAAQGDDSPCEGPDEPDEGMYLQYSTNGGATWTTINYFDPNGGNDPNLVNWNNWCFQMPQGALTNSVQFRWFQDADSGSEYDHWGIDNVEIIVNDPNVVFEWQHDNYTTSLPGENPTPVCPLVSTSYTVVMTTPSNATCQATVDIDVVNPDVIVDAGTDQSVCLGDCINLQGDVRVVNRPASTPTFSNVQTQLLDPSVGVDGATVNVNVQGLNMNTVQPGSIVEVCVDGLTFFGVEISGFPPTFTNQGIESISLDLICPDGTVVNLVPAGVISPGQNGDSYSNACFVPSGGNSISGATAPITGTFSPSQSLSGFDGCTANGVWSLEVNTTSSIGFGSFDGWSITFDDPEISYVPDVLWSPTTYMAAGQETTLTPQVCPTADITYTLTASDTAGCVTVTDDVNITIDPNCCATNTSAITGPTNLCGNATGQTFSVTNTTGSTYTWTVPAGATITSGQGTNSITVSFGMTGGDITVIETINCGDGPPVTHTVVIDNCLSCEITTLGLSMSDCYTSGGMQQYDVDGVVNFSDPPLTGTLTITSCQGVVQTFNAPFGADQGFSFTAIPQDGNPCDFVAVFSDDPTCTATTGIAPPPSIDFYSASCGIGSGEVSGTVEFSNAPSTGTLVISVFDGTSTVEVELQPPFNSPESWTVPGLDPGMPGYEVSYYFSDHAGCGQTQTVICGCTAEAGSTTATVNGTVSQNPILCEDDVLNITTNNNFTFPEDEGPINGFDYQPALVYLVYNCPPTPGLVPNNDPCFVAPIPIEENIGNVNDATNSIIALLPPGTFTNGRVYFAPITLYHYDPIAPNFIINLACWDLGTVTSVTYLEPITSTVTPDCQSGSVTVNLSGGRPANNGSVFTASGLTPSNATFANTTTPDNGDIVVENLLQGDMYAFSVTDAAGCPHPVTGGPFQALPIADAGSDESSCDLSYTLAPTPSYGNVTWTGGPVGTVFAPDANTANATVTVPSAGTYTFTWTEDNGNGCIASDDVDVTFSVLSIPAVITDASCGQSDGEVVVAPQGGTAPYSYSWTSGGTGPVENGLPAGSVTVTVTDAMGCTLDSTFVITMPAAFTFTTDAEDVSCFEGCDGEASVTPVGNGPFSYVWSPNGGNAATATGLCAGDYEVEITEQGGCIQTATITIGSPTQVGGTVSSDVTTICIGQSATLTGDVAGGTAPYGGFFWVATPADPSLTPTDQNPTVSPTVTTSYSFVATDANGCATAPKEVEIVVLPPLTLDVVRPTSADTSICPYDMATIDLTATGGDGDHTYYLLPNVTAPITLPLDTQPAVTTTLEFMVTDGCSTPAANASATVTILPLPVVDFTGDPLSGCDPHTVQFTDLTQPPAGQWAWDFGDPDSGSGTATTDTPSHTFSASGTYDISLTAWSAEGCVNDTVLSDFVEVFDVPTAYFDFSPSVTTLLNADIQFTDASSGNIDTWTWTFGDGSGSLQPDPSHRYRDTGMYVITLTVITPEGCSDTAQSELIVDPDFTFYIPNAFTPNHNTKNETFRPYGEGVDWDTFEMRIFTRWGEEIYYTTRVERPWDGFYNGIEVESGVYVYSISIMDIRGEQHDYRGRVTVLR